MRPWILKYTPDLDGIQGQDTPMARLREHVQAKKRKKALFIYGPTGCGKTSSVYALARSLDLEVLELNASDFRNKNMIDSTVGSAINQRSLLCKSKVILVDEVDGLSGRDDRGGVLAIAKLVEQSSFPIVVTAVDPWEKKLSALRKKCELLQYNPLSYISVFNVLKKIADSEGLEYDESALKRLARMAGGDLRAAINDLQTLSSEKVTDAVVDSLSDRDRKTKIMDALRIIFKSKQPDIVRHVLDNVDEDIDKIKLWIDENLPKEYEDPFALAHAYESLSRADVFQGRIMRRQHWRFMVYQYAHLSVGVALAKDEKSKKFVSYKPTGRILEMWKAKMKYQKRKAIAEKVALHTHTSTSEAIRSTIPYLALMMKDKRWAASIEDQLELDADEIKWLGEHAKSL